MNAMVNKADATKTDGEAYLSHAILGTAHQCSKCEKFQQAGYWVAQHEKHCHSGQMYRVPFATIKGKYFCYFGCFSIDARKDLIKHLLAEHSEMIWVWGLSKDLLAQSIEERVTKRDTPSFGDATFTQINTKRTENLN